MQSNIDLDMWEAYMDDLEESGEMYQPLKGAKYKHNEWQERKKEDGKLSRKEREERLNARGKIWNEED